VSRILAIDPGPTESAYALIDNGDRPLYFEKLPNTELLAGLHINALGQAADHIVIEMVASYGMAVGKDVFETCVWIGRLVEVIHVRVGREPQLVYRRDVKLHHCHSAKASDANVKQALVDRFASGVRNHGKGTKDAPGFFYGFKADVWQAYALAVYTADHLEPYERPVSEATA